MPLQRRPVQVPLAGLNTKLDPKSAPVGVLTLVENMFQQQAGLWRKRNGVTRNTNLDRNGFSPLSVQGYASLGNTSVMLDLRDSSNTSTTAAVAMWDSQTMRWSNPYAGATVCRTTQASITPILAPKVSSTPISAETPDCAAANGLELYCCGNPGTAVAYVVRNATTGAIPISLSLTNAQQPQARAASNRYLCLFYVDTGSNNLKCAVMDTQGTTLTATTTTVAAVKAASGVRPYDVLWIPSQSKFAVAYYTNVANALGLLYFDPATGAVSSSSQVAGDPTLALGWLQDTAPGTNIYIGICGSTNGVQVKTIAVSGLTVSATATIDAASTTARNITGDNFSGTIRFFYEVPGATVYNTAIYASFSLGAGTLNLRSVGLASRPFQIDGCMYMLLNYESTQQSQYILWAFNGRPCGQLYYARAPGMTFYSGCLAGAITVSNAQVRLPVVKAIRQILNGTTYASFQSLDALTLGVGAPHATEALDMLWLSGMQGRVFDRVIEKSIPFFQAPEDPTLTPLAAGSMTASSTYRYMTMWSYQDATGRVWRSPPSNPINVTLGVGQGTVQITQPCYRVEGQSAVNVVLEVYRANGATSTDFRIVSNDGVTASFTANIPSVDTVSFNDAMSDTNQQKREPIYTTGNVLINYPPPPSKATALHQNRVWLVSAEDPRELWPSKQLRVGFGAAWHPNLNVRIDDTVEGITNVMSMDTTLVAFKPHGIWAITGDGPNDLGQGEWGLPQRISVDVGLADPRAAVLTPLGIIFKSDKGFYLLSRSMQLEYIGAPVETWNSLTTNGATIVQGVDQVRFTSNEGRTLVYDWTLKQWYTWTNQACVGSALLNGTWSYMDSSGFSYVEAPGVYSDNGTAIISRVTIAPIATAGIGGFQRIYGLALVGGYVGDHTLNVAVTYDYAAASAQTISAAITSSTGLPIIRGRVAQQKCGAFGLDVTDSFPGSPSGGFTLSALLLTVGSKEGVNFGTSTQLS